LRKALSVLAILLLALGCEKVKETTVSGKVTDGAAGPVSGAVVLLLGSDSLEAGMNLSGGSVTLADGTYEMIRVEPGSYYVPAIRDVNSNGTLDSLDLFGWFGPESSWTYWDSVAVETVSVTITVAEQIVVTEGQNKTDVNIDTLYTFPPAQ